MIFRPKPLAAGHLTVTVPSGLAVAVTDAGAAGTSAVGVTGGVLALGPAPTEFTACTVNLYALPLVRFLMITDRWFAPTVTVWPPPATTYFAMAAPLSRSFR